MKSLRNKVMVIATGLMIILSTTAYAVEPTTYEAKSFLSEKIKGIITNLGADMQMTVLEWLALIIPITIVITMIGLAAKKGVSILIKRVKKAF